MRDFNTSSERMLVISSSNDMQASEPRIQRLGHIIENGLRLKFPTFFAESSTEKDARGHARIQTLTDGDPAKSGKQRDYWVVSGCLAA